MRILLMPNALKGSMPASAFCKYAKVVFKNKYSLTCLPVSDGGDGILDVFESFCLSAKKYKVKALNAVYKQKTAPYLILPGARKTCIIETAKVCGLGGLKKSELMPLKATSFGLGQVIVSAVKKGANNFYIGLGGVACNDAGCGLAQALGAGLFNAKGNALKGGAGELLKLSKITLPKGFFKGINFTGISDVTNPLLGPKGSAYVYGPQKGANKKQVEVMERALTNFAAVIKKDLHKNINKPRCGAAGAIAAGLYGFLNADLVDGASFILKNINAEDKIKQCDIVVTSEGKLDRQTFFGKAPQAVCKLALKHKKPVVFICGINEITDSRLLKKHGIVKVIELSALAKNRQDSIKNSAKYLKQALRRLDFSALV